jgi:hypothetical protein
VKTSPKRSYSVIENERFGLVFTKTGSIISGTGHSGSESYPQARPSNKLTNFSHKSWDSSKNFEAQT